MSQESFSHAEIKISSEDGSYPSLLLTPVVNGNSGSLSVVDYHVRKQGERYGIDNLPLSLALPKDAMKDVIYWTFEVEEEDRKPFFALELMLQDQSDKIDIKLRAVENPDLPDLLFYEYCDDADDWRPLVDVDLIDILHDSFMLSMEAMVLDSLRTGDLLSLPSVLDAAE